MQKMAEVIRRGIVSLPIYTIDAFSSKPFAGNPAAICVLKKDEDVPDSIKQKIASEINISETAYLSPLDDKSVNIATNFNLRWFTPTNEVPLCGHATLATAAVVYNIYGNQASQLNFNTKSGVLTAKKKIGGFIALDLPYNPPEKRIPDEILKNLIKVVVGSLEYDDVQYNTTTQKLLVRLKNSNTRAHLEAIKPDPQQMLKLYTAGDIFGVIVTLSSAHGNGKGDVEQREYDFLSRYFAPWNGVAEDPVCGSAHTVLAPYWCKVLNKKDFFVRQCSPRGGELSISITDNQRVELRGQAAVVIKGEIQLHL